MLIFEGTNYTGKTTAARKAVEMLNLQGYSHVYQHLDRPADCFDFYWGYADLIRKNVVMDRFHWSEHAYAGAEDTWPRQNAEEFDRLSFDLGLVPVVTVVLSYHMDESGMELLRSRHDASVKKRYPLTKIKAVNEVYDRYAKEFIHPWNGNGVIHVPLDSTSPYCTDEILDSIVDAYIERRRWVAQLDRRRKNKWTK